MRFEDLIVMHTISKYPGSASANRINALAHSLKELGYKVIILCKYNSDSKELKTGDSYYYNGIEFRPYKDKKKITNKLINRFLFLSVLKENFDSEELKRVKCIYFTHKNYTLLTMLSLKKNKIKSVVDVTEFHEPFQFKYKIFDIKYLIHLFNIKLVIPNSQNIISITTYLKNIYDNKSKNTIVVPPQIIINDYKAHNDLEYNPVKFMYAGTITNKDYIGEILEGLCLLSEKDKHKVKFEIVGGSEEDFKKEFSNWFKYMNELKNVLTITNRIPKKELEKKLSNVHYTILLRPRRRYSEAGFPSKVPESLAAGVPVILNETSDLKDYIKDGVNGFIIKDFSALEVSEAIKSALSLNRTQYKNLSTNAYLTAKNNFDYTANLGELAKFLKNLK